MGLLEDFDTQVIWRPCGNCQACIYQLCLWRDLGMLIFWQDEDSEGVFFEIWIKSNESIIEIALKGLDDQ